MSYAYKSIFLDLVENCYKNINTTFTERLSEKDPDAPYLGSSLYGLDAYERQLYRYDIKVTGKDVDTIAKFYSSPESAILFPEFIRRTVMSGVNENHILDKITNIDNNKNLMYVVREPKSNYYSIWPINKTSDSDRYFNYTVTYYTLLSAYIADGKELYKPLSINKFTALLKQDGRIMRAELIRRIVNIILDNFKDDVNEISTNDNYKFDNGKTIICNFGTFHKVFDNTFGKETLKYVEDINNISTKLDTDIIICKSIPNDIIINLDKDLAIQLNITNMKIENYKEIIEDNFSSIFASWVVDGCIFDKSAINVYKIKNNTTINCIDPYFSIPTIPYNSNKNNDCIIKVDCMNTSNSTIDTTNTTYAELNNEDTKVSKYFNESEIGKWKINADGYYPYCPYCYYEPTGEYIKHHSLPMVCPNCKTDMGIELEEKIRG